jgi:hypothetical protein
MRARDAELLGYERGSPEWRQFVVTGEMPDPAARPMTAEERAQWGIPATDTTPYKMTDNGPVAIGGGGTTINNNMGGDAGQYIYGTDAGVPAGWRVDTTTGVASPIPGGPAAVEAENLETKAENTKTQGAMKLGTSLESINLNIKEIEDGGLPVTGAIGDARRTWVGRALTGDSAVDFGNRSSQVTDAAALAEIQNMRDNSPTGGAVGALTDGERVALGNARTAMNASTSGPEYVRAAKAYRKLALDLAYGEGMWDLTDDGGVIPKGVAAPPANDLGLSEDDLKYLGQP